MVSNFPDEKVWKWVCSNMDRHTTTSVQSANDLNSEFYVMWVFSTVKREIILAITRFCVNTRFPDSLQLHNYHKNELVI